MTRRPTTGARLTGQSPPRSAPAGRATAKDLKFMRLALRLARHGLGATSPNPAVGAVLVHHGRVLGRGWHHRAGAPHAEIEALSDARHRGHNPAGATLYVTLEPCCTQGRTPACTDALIEARISRVVVAAVDPNPAHSGRGLRLLQAAGVAVDAGPLADAATRLNEPFNHWITTRRPLVTCKVAMTLDGKLATATGESKWITGIEARAQAMRLRAANDAILVGINTLLADDPSLTVRPSRRAAPGSEPKAGRHETAPNSSQPRRIILDSRARLPLTARVVSDAWARRTTVVVTRSAPEHRVAALRRRANVLVAPGRAGRIRLPWLLRRLGAEQVTSLLVEGGGEVLGEFLGQRLAHRIAFFYAPKVLGGHDARRAVAALGAGKWAAVLKLEDLSWRRCGPDLLLTARLARSAGSAP